MFEKIRAPVQSTGLKILYIKTTVRTDTSDGQVVYACAFITTAKLLERSVEFKMVSSYYAIPISSGVNPE